MGNSLNKQFHEWNILNIELGRVRAGKKLGDHLIQKFPNFQRGPPLQAPKQVPSWLYQKPRSIFYRFLGFLSSEMSLG